MLLTAEQLTYVKNANETLQELSSSVAIFLPFHVCLILGANVKGKKNEFFVGEAQ